MTLSKGIEAELSPQDRELGCADPRIPAGEFGDSRGGIPTWCISRLDPQDPKTAKDLRRLKMATPPDRLITSLLYRIDCGRWVAMMSDAPVELEQSAGLFARARGDILIHGLGLGCVLRPLLARPAVTSITVLELSRSLVERVAPFYQDPRLKVLVADARCWTPPSGSWDVIWTDIWPMSSMKNLPDARAIGLRYVRRCRGSHGFWFGGSTIWADYADTETRLRAKAFSAALTRRGRHV